MVQSGYESWGRFPRAEPARVIRRFWPEEWDLGQVEGTMLPYGLGRSYGDVCLNGGGAILNTAEQDRFLSFDEASGVLHCEAGVSLDGILHAFLPRGWFLPVTPGTRYVTVGGAIANDVHGKNHHRAGTFGSHVEEITLRRSDGETLTLSPARNIEMFSATVGGLGLTGLILDAKLRLKRVTSARISCETVKFGHVEEFFELASESDRKFEYTVAWADGLAVGESLGRGHFIRGNHVEALVTPDRQIPSLKPPRITVPCDLPACALNRLTARAFNAVYYRRFPGRIRRAETSIESFFYPLDGIGRWNRLYGRRGFFQYQIVVPVEHGRRVIPVLLDTIARSRHSSFLAVLKVFGEAESPGLMSFPMPGATLAMDFPNRGKATRGLFDALDAIVTACGGRAYPAKDARMTRENFRAFFPRRAEFERYIDPRFSSNFWRRVS